MLKACAWILLAAIYGSAAGGVAPGPRALAQARDRPFHVKTNLVDLSFTARDADGALVSDLSQNEVEVYEDGAPQKIAFFSPASDVPLTLGLIVDASESQDHFTRQHLHDLEVFLKEVLRPRDRVFLLCFGNHLRLASDFTNSPQELLHGMDVYEHRDRAKIPEIGPGEDRDLGTAFYDAIFYSIVEKMAGAAGRRVLMVFSDGEDNSSAHDMMDTIEAAQSANVQLYTLRYTEKKHGKLTARNKYGIAVMDRAAKETGATTVDAAAVDPKLYFRAIAEELRNSYELAYYPTGKSEDGTFHNIAIKASRGGVIVKARTGYLAKGSE